MNDLDTGDESTISKFADNTKLRGEVKSLGGQDTFQRELDRLEH